MHDSLHAWSEVCAQKCQACSPDTTDTLISLIHSNFAEILARAHKHIECMQTSLFALGVLYTQIGLVCSPNSIDTFIFPIQPNFVEI